MKKRKNIGILSLGASGNILSICRAIETVGAKPKLLEKNEDFNNISGIILPGVGSFSSFMSSLESADLMSILTAHINQKPVLGICLGMQILAKRGYENGSTEGLGIVDAEVIPILVDANIPHMGFNKLHTIKESPILKGMESEAFYFMHSYEVVNYTNVVSLTDYQGHRFVSCIHLDNIFGVQFHPEKSRQAGLRLFENFITYEG